MTISLSIHPFPARMAPEIALEAIERLPRGASVLDPMAGSGTVLRTAINSGHPAIGYDVDPLAVLMSRVWVTPVDTDRIRAIARKTAVQAEDIDPDNVSLPWIDGDYETMEFIRFWYDTPQINDLRRISWILAKRHDAVGNALRVAMSRLIIQKKRGASLAGDVSHSRPHRIRTTNDFDVISEFVRSSDLVAKRLEQDKPAQKAVVKIGDARRMTQLKDASVDAIVSSPPYLNAIDYLRGHKMSLVWIGYRISELRRIRAKSVGAQRALDPQADSDIVKDIVASYCEISSLPSRKLAMIVRYAYDVNSIIGEANRVLRPGGIAVYVVGNSCLGDVRIDNDNIVINAARRYGWRLVERYERELLKSKRYMPPPNKSQLTPINQRMGTECIVTFRKPKPHSKYVKTKFQ